MMRALKKSLCTFLIRKNFAKPARRLSLSKTFPDKKLRHFRNSPCSYFATPRAQLAKFLTWSMVHEQTHFKCVYPAAAPSNTLARTLLPIPLDQRYDAQDILTRLGKIL